ncbi:MAG TPA: hypothetical protein V6C78_22950 [Crinalium sp.]|jgi:hypothetical protein
MRFFSFTVISGLMLAGFSLTHQHGSVNAAQIRPVNHHQVHLASSDSRSRTTSYRGSGRRAILASPTSQLPVEG